MAAAVEEYEEYTMEFLPDEDGEEWVVEECSDEEFDYEDYSEEEEYVEEIADGEEEEYYEEIVEEIIVEEEEDHAPFVPPTEIAFDSGHPANTSARSAASTISVDASESSLAKTVKVSNAKSAAVPTTPPAALPSAPSPSTKIPKPPATTTPATTPATTTTTTTTTQSTADSKPRLGEGLGNRFKKMMQLPEKSAQREDHLAAPPVAPCNSPQKQPETKVTSVMPSPQPTPQKSPHEQQQKEISPATSTSIARVQRSATVQPEKVQSSQQPNQPPIKTRTKGRVARPGAPRPTQPQPLAAILTAAPPSCIPPSRVVAVTPTAAPTPNAAPTPTAASTTLAAAATPEQKPKQTRLIRKLIRRKKDKTPEVVDQPSAMVGTACMGADEVTNNHAAAPAALANRGTSPAATHITTTDTTNATESTEANSNEPKVVHSLTVLRDETAGREISRVETGKRPPRFQANNAANQKRYLTKTIRKSRINPINKHKEIEESTITYEKPQSAAVMEALPPIALQPSTGWNPARKTTQWEQPVWVKNKMEAGSTIRTGANLEKPITTATTTNRAKPKGTLNFTIERG